MYKKLLILISISIILFLSTCSPKAMYQTSWQTKPVVVDGDPSEWFIPLRFYDADTKLNYTLSNDDEKIYLCVRIVDELSQAKVIRNGINIWFDTLAKKNKQCGILFPVPDKGGDEYQSDGATGGGGSHHRGDGSGKHGSGDNDAIKKKFLRQANQMQLIGFKKGIPDYLAPENEYGINVSINWDANNIMIYEAAIPFKAFYKPALVAKDSLRNFDFSMTIHGFPAPEKKDDGNSGGGGMGGAGGGMGGGMPGGGGGMPGGGGMGGAGGRGGMGGGGMGGGRGGGGGMRGAGSAEVNPMYETKSFWVKVRLSAK
jgi:hypothetical protein